MTMKLTFHGAARTVTGSCYVLDTGHHRVMVDCGMFQGSKTESALNYRDFPFQPERIDALLLTHAHIDHSGLIPKLVKRGFRGPIHATEATIDLCSIMLPDSGHIQEMEVRQLNERNRHRGRPLVEPIYDMADASVSLKQLSIVRYGDWFAPVPGMRARYWNAGHLLGSASIEIEIGGNGSEPLRILFSGDVGPLFKLLEPDPQAPSGLDYIICEATYGAVDRPEQNEIDRRKHLALEIVEASRRGGALLIPSFAVERTQELVTDLAILIDEGVLPHFPLFIDSPLAFKATHIFGKYASSLDNGDRLLKAFKSPHVRSMETVEQSKSLNRLSGFFAVIAASGMCEAGRIRHHLKNHLWQSNTTVLLASFQAAGTLGRLLADGVQRVRIQGEEIEVKAAIRRIDEYSGHADGPELLAWLQARAPVRRGVFLVHGEDPGLNGLTERIAGTLIEPNRIFRPSLDESYDLTGPAPSLVPAAPRRLAPQSVGSFDWNNDLAELILHINDRVAKAADEKSRAVILRRLRRALTAEEPG
jgi:metallo-beta-lactamase family protein